MDVLRRIGKTYLKGSGIEIGALHRPFPVAPGTRVTYVDRLCEEDLRQQYPELGNVPFVNTDVLDDGESLAAFADQSQDFVIAGHFLEHCRDPIRAMENMVRVTRDGGIVFLAVPDMRFTFDIFRPVTPLAHLIADHENGAAASAGDHYRDYLKFVSRCCGEEALATAQQKLMAANYSIHFHAWRQCEILELIAYLEREKKLPVICEEVLRGENDCRIVLRKMFVLTEYESLAARVRNLDISPDGTETVFDQKMALGKKFAAAAHPWAAACLFSEAAELKPENIPAHILAAAARISAGDLAEARRVLIGAQKLDPANEVVGKMLAALKTHPKLFGSKL